MWVQMENIDMCLPSASLLSLRSTRVLRMAAVVLLHTPGCHSVAASPTSETIFAITAMKRFDAACMRITLPRAGALFKDHMTVNADSHLIQKVTIECVHDRATPSQCVRIAPLNPTAFTALLHHDVLLRVASSAQITSTPCCSSVSGIPASSIPCSF